MCIGIHTDFIRRVPSNTTYMIQKIRPDPHKNSSINKKSNSVVIHYNIFKTYS